MKSPTMCKTTVYFSIHICLVRFNFTMEEPIFSRLTEMFIFILYSTFLKHPVYTIAHAVFSPIINPSALCLPRDLSLTKTGTPNRNVSLLLTYLRARQNLEQM